MRGANQQLAVTGDNDSSTVMINMRASLVTQW